jgi:hypothetical protein
MGENEPGAIQTPTPAVTRTKDERRGLAKEMTSRKDEFDACLEIA